MKIQIFHQTRVRKIFEQNNESLAFNVYFHHKIMKKQRLYMNQSIILSDKIPWFY